MTDTHLFLFGGSPPMTELLANRFAETLRDKKGTIALLYIEREGSEEYLPKYSLTLRDYAPELEIFSLPIEASYTKEQLNQLRDSSGIIIGGGDTLAYYNYIVETEVAEVIQDQFQKGVPVAGFSAGALISPENCVISPKDNPKEITLYQRGLGLLMDGVLSAHYLKWKEQDQLKKVITHTDVGFGYGIADESGIYFENQKLTTIEGYVHIENNSTSGHPYSG
ncbi:Type 1 glutamine amidotransferase-like domain-containing protein [Halobacillus naozhouensis]|uniref:Type 1 glutamine amidotransferase-like domain-containing protein n=1 Tax=Halobacillus naozhouensis TaxID=554880 RepID=A0ABY8IZI5_9BACI|nr:Type 1 glutamine amidotransferase-like domain-containing protein [Halobacillus naozhouensis]WFT74603.1 Type 1 glutamine amidotransferase-like domain-containing protein [Halobacillus naozhouensis]